MLKKGILRMEVMRNFRPAQDRAVERGESEEALSRVLPE